MAKKPKLSPVEIDVPLHEDDRPYARRLVRVDAARCLALGNRYARWLHGDEPGALLDLGGYFAHATPHALPDGRVVLSNAEGLVVVGNDHAEAHRFAFEKSLHVHRSGLSAGGLLLTGVSEPFAVWVDLEGRQTHLVEARGGAVVHGGGVAFELATGAGVLRVTRHEGPKADVAELPWEATESGHFALRDVAVGDAAARDGRLVVTHPSVRAAALWDGAGPRRVETPAGIHLARLGADFAALRTTGPSPSLVALDAGGAVRWSAPVASFADLYAVGGFALSVERKGAKAALFDAKTGAEGFRGDLALSRADDIASGAVDAVPGGVAVTARRHGEPQKWAWLLTPGGDPLKVPHEGIAGAIPWGDDAFATWRADAGAALSLRVWRR